MEDTTSQFQIAQDKAQPLLDLDPHRLSQRQRQVDFGKNTAGYAAYAEKVPRLRRKQRTLNHPTTPDIHAPVSKRCFDGQVKAWRRALHKWEPAGLQTALDLGDLMTPSESECGSAHHASYAAALSGSAPSSRAPSESGTPRGFLARQPSFTPCSINNGAPARTEAGSGAAAAQVSRPGSVPEGARPTGSSVPAHRKRGMGRFAADQAEDMKLQSPTKKLRHQIAQTNDTMGTQGEATDPQWADENQTPAAGLQKLPNGLKAPLSGKQLLLSAGQQSLPKKVNTVVATNTTPAAASGGIFGDWDEL